MSVTERELTAWGEQIGAEVRAPVVLALRGELGAGKSVLARAIARGAGVRGAKPSPTFTLVYRYHGSRGGEGGEDEVEVWHLDLYRLEDPDEVWELGWRELGGDRQIVLIEWPERAEELLPRVRWDIYLEPAGREGERVVRLVRRGAAPELPELPELPGAAQ
jgi:tRNA threonylcarbamoyladenosine biosynthesis protein TsaE